MLAGINPLMMSGGAAGTFSTWNPSDKSSNVTLSNANLTATMGASGDWRTVRGIKSASAGKLYAEMRYLSGMYVMFGLANASHNLSTQLGSNSSGIGYYNFGGNAQYNGSSTSLSGLGSIVANDIMRCAVDFAGGQVWFGRNANWSGNPAAGTGGVPFVPSGAIFPALCCSDTGSGTLFTGVAPGALIYPPPSGFTAWG